MKRKANIAAAWAIAFVVSALAASVPWSPADELAPADFGQVVSKRAQPGVYYVGFNVLYRSKHIPGAIFAGPAGEAKGIEVFKAALAEVPRDREIVLYCGCCPIDKCPNLRPAFRVAREMGFKKVRVLMLPTSFGIDWVEKGYPVQTRQAGR